ncbi:MAG TPA: hypothetical protein VMG41_00060 [Gemmatimonadales bacterium]|nr:hypothetical protein [Gemmatimonadales bacterium]
METIRNAEGRTPEPSPEQYGRFSELVHLVKVEFQARTGRSTIAVTGVRPILEIEIDHADGHGSPWLRTVTTEELTRPNLDAVARAIVAQFLSAR